MSGLVQLSTCIPCNHFSILSNVDCRVSSFLCNFANTFFFFVRYVAAEQAPYNFRITCSIHADNKKSVSPLHHHEWVYFGWSVACRMQVKTVTRWFGRWSVLLFWFGARVCVRLSLQNRFPFAHNFLPLNLLFIVTVRTKWFWRISDEANYLQFCFVFFFIMFCVQIGCRRMIPSAHCAQSLNSRNEQVCIESFLLFCTHITFESHWPHPQFASSSSRDYFAFCLLFCRSTSLRVRSTAIRCLVYTLIASRTPKFNIKNSLSIRFFFHRSSPAHFCLSESSGAVRGPSIDWAAFA